MSESTTKAIEIAKRDLETARRAVRMCEHELTHAKAAARAAAERLKALQGAPTKVAS